MKITGIAWQGYVLPFRDEFRTSRDRAALYVTHAHELTEFTGYDEIESSARIVALLGASIVSSTDAAAVFAVFRARGMQVKQRLVSLLEVEKDGVDDPADGIEHRLRRRW